MSDTVILALIVGLPLIITSLSNLITSVRNARQVAKVVDKLDVVHDQMNGMKTELIRATGAEAQAVGEAIGREKATAERQVRVVEAERVEDRAKESQ